MSFGAGELFWQKWQTGRVCWVNDDGAASWYSRVVAMWRCWTPPPSAPLYTMANMIQLSVERISKESVCFLHKLMCWIPGRAKSSFQLHNPCVHTYGGVGPMCLMKKGPELKSVLCVLWDECVREDTIPEWGDWGSLELAGPLWLQKTFTTMATGGSLCSWVKGQLGEFSLSSNRKAFVALGTQGWLQLVPCEIARTAKAI